MGKGVIIPIVITVLAIGAVVTVYFLNDRSFDISNWGEDGGGTGGTTQQGTADCGSSTALQNADAATNFLTNPDGDGPFNCMGSNFKSCFESEIDVVYDSADNAVFTLTPSGDLCLMKYEASSQSITCDFTKSQTNNVYEQAKTEYGASKTGIAPGSLVVLMSFSLQFEEPGDTTIDFTDSSGTETQITCHVEGSGGTGNGGTGNSDCGTTTFLQNQAATEAWLNNPGGDAELTCMADNYPDCLESQVLVTSDTEPDGTFSLNPGGNLCVMKYEETDKSIACDFTKVQASDLHNDAVTQYGADQTAILPGALIQALLFTMQITETGDTVMDYTDSQGNAIPITCHVVNPDPITF